MRDGLIQALGFAIVALALADVFLTVLHARGDAGVLSTRLNRALWFLIREGSKLAGRRREQIRAYAGPLALVLTVGMWVGLITFGFALVAWPDLGTAIRSPVMRTPTDFFTALYYSGMALTTLGLGDFMPLTRSTRGAMLAEALLGFSVVTLSLTYFLGVYNALTRRNAFASELHYMSARTGDAAELLVRIGSGGEFDGDARSDLAAVARELLLLLQTHHAYPVIHMFHQMDISQAPSRVALLTLDTATLVRSALDPARYHDFIDSAAVEMLWDGGLQLLIESGRDLLSDAELDATAVPDAVGWRDRYITARARLEAAGYAVAPDVGAGAEAYARQRRRWDRRVRAFAAHMGHDWADIELNQSASESAA